jgi:tetratricopeptide (TPR) repeat protein
MLYIQKKIVLTILIGLFFSAFVQAANEGRADLDKATEAKLSATTLSELGEVINLTESALEKGLDESNTAFANKLLASACVQRATAVTSVILKSSPPDPRWQQFRQFAMSDLDKALKLDAKQPQALMLVAQMNLLPEGDAKRAKEAIDQAIEFSGDEPRTKAKALILRAGMEENADKQMADMNEAVRILPDDADVYRSRALLLASKDKYDEAMADLDKAIELDADNAPTYLLKSRVLTGMKKYDEALEPLEKILKLSPNSIDPWLEKTRIHSLQKKLDEAIEDMNRAVSLDPINGKWLLLRCSLYLEKGDKEKALKDAQESVRLNPKSIVALRTTAAILADMDHMDKAATLLEKVKQLDPKDPESNLQLGMLFTMQKKSGKAIEIYTEYLKDNSDEAKILRARADAYLNIGKHAEAIEDYEKAIRNLSKDPGYPGSLNNFAWVLATSPEDKLRDGDRALKLALEAAELTEYKEAYILSTLAAAYAETGDFENALKWATKAMELGDEGHAEEYKKELASFKDHKPFRESLSEKEDDKPVKKSAKSADKSDKQEDKPEQSAEKTAAPEEKPAAPKEPAAKSFELFNGRNLDGWTLKQPNDRSHWTVGTARVDPQNPRGLISSFASRQPGELINLEGKGVNIFSEKKFGDCTIELEFMIPEESNSGVYVMGEYEIQIFDSFEKTELMMSDLGAIYGAAVPKINAAKSPGEWQTMVIDFKAPRFADDAKTANARFVKITLNGQTIQENVEMKGPTPGGLTGKESATGPLMIQGDHGPVAFRNIKITTEKR